MNRKTDYPPHHTICSICKDDGECRNNVKSKYYDDFYSDYLDCWVYLRNHEPLEQKLKREQRVEVWDMKNKVWVKKNVS